MNRALVSSTIAALLCTAASVASAQQAFKTPDEAAAALVSAAKAGDAKAIVTVLGPDGDDIASSGDEVADATTRQKFVAAYDAKHQITMEGDNKAVMVIGPEDYPTSDTSRPQGRNVALRCGGGPRGDSRASYRQKRAGCNSGLACLC